MKSDLQLFNNDGRAIASNLSYTKKLRREVTKKQMKEKKVHSSTNKSLLIKPASIMSNYSTEVAKLISEGSRAYSSKDFDLASEKYGEACEEYSKSHQGNEDADLLFLYGKAVFKVV